MNRTKIKNYAPKARQEFIQAVTDRAAFHGMKEVEDEVVIEPAVARGDSVLIGGRAFPGAVGEKRKKLEEQVRRHGFPQTMETLAYTWFNRLVAIRFMELHGYLDHGYRVLSHPEGKPTPEILEHAEHVELPGLDKQRVIDLKIEGTKEAELYRLLLVAQCNALHDAMPFLFERIDDETELVLPDSLLHSNSLIRNLVNEIDEEDWQAVEMIGWLYESYISERYEAVIGKVVASEDIPAATQRFTPKWIVRYLVQNTLGRLWLATYPQSALRQQMKYYIEPAEQTPEVKEQLKAITPPSLNPEEITFLDPACGSAHILVEAYDLFKAIYQERGYRAKDIPSLILRKNLFGLEIDDRAAQLAAFALLMKARADDRRLFQADEKVQPHVLALQETKGQNTKDITTYLNEPVLTQPLPPSGKLFEDERELFSKANMSVAGDLAQADIATLIDLFEDAKTFGSLIQVPPIVAGKLPHIEERVRLVAQHGEGFNRLYATDFLRFVEQAKQLGRRFDCVVANPPYMGSKYYTPTLKSFVSRVYKNAKADLCTAFIERGFDFVQPSGYFGEITMQSWMFLSSFETFRAKLIKVRTITTMAHLGPHAFPNIGGQVVQVTAFTAKPQMIEDYRGSFKRLIEGQSHEKEQRFGMEQSYTPRNVDFAKIPGSPISFWASPSMCAAFSGAKIAGGVLSEGYVKTGNNAKYIRCCWEVKSDTIGSKLHWRLHPRGGEFRKWYGNVDEVVDWSPAARQHYKADSIARILDERFWDLGGVCWSEITISNPAFRLLLPEEIANNKSPAIYSKDGTDLNLLIGFLNSTVASLLLSLLNPTIGFGPGDILRLPLPSAGGIHVAGTNANRCIDIARSDWNSFETAWNFQTLPALQHKAPSVQQSQQAADEVCHDRFLQMKELEEEDNRIFINAYGLQDELSSAVPDEEITLYRPDRDEDIKRLLSYAIGCMMGRFSLDKPGLVYAYAENVGFDPSQYTTFAADSDSILPLTQLDWGFEDDMARRIEEFVAVAWPRGHLAENLKFIADSLGPAKDEQPRDTIRRYLATGFYKDHLRWYKRRPIYWLFSSGRQRAFQCLVYLHRYHEGTLARMRTEYVIPLQGRIAARIEQLEGDKTKATSTSHRRKLQKEQDDLKKQQIELAGFDEKLKHAADMRIKLDLDDGVKANYGKFGDLLAEVKAVTGGKDED